MNVQITQSQESNTKNEIIKALKSIIDPELAVDIVTLGLIRDIKVVEEEGKKKIHILMTLTTPLCPFADIIVQDVETHVSLLGYGDPVVSLTFDPPWEVTDDLKMLLGV